MRVLAITQLRICSADVVAPRSFSLTCSQMRSRLRSAFGMKVWWKSHAPLGAVAWRWSADPSAPIMVRVTCMFLLTRSRVSGGLYTRHVASWLESPAPVSDDAPESHRRNWTQHMNRINRMYRGGNTANWRSRRHCRGVMTFSAGGTDTA